MYTNKQVTVNNQPNKSAECCTCTPLESYTASDDLKTHGDASQHQPWGQETRAALQD